MMGKISRAVLITGCSTGIGRATAERLARRGMTVYASARRPETISDLGELGCETLALDVTDEASMRAAVDAVTEAEGAVGALVNNAGYSQSGALETLPMDKVRAQFETNVFGLLRLSQLCLPGMRAQGWGRVLNISSVGGRTVFPGGGAYHATKWAVEALSDALRFEVRRFGVDVVVIEPGLITTAFAERVDAEMATETDGPYAAFNETVRRSTLDAYASPMIARTVGGSADDVAKVIEKAIRARRPRTRYRITPSATLPIVTRRLVPDRVWDRFVGMRYPQPGP